MLRDRRQRPILALALATSLAACGGASETSEPRGEPVPTTTTAVAPTLPAHPDSASSYDVTLSTNSARPGSVVTVTVTLPPRCLEEPTAVSVTFADEQLQRAGVAGTGKRVPHRLMGTTLTATYTVVPEDSPGNALFIVRCEAGGDGVAALRIVR